jgi:hypothetical protein
MEQHPVPQNVTTFQFRLIGDMTIKQFGELAGGAMLGYIIYRLPFPTFIGLPIGVGIFLLGFGFAFVPVEERPMDVWFLAFIKSIYSPTLYVWQRQKPVPEPVEPTSVVPQKPNPIPNQAPTKPADQTAVKPATPPFTSTVLPTAFSKNTMATPMKSVAPDKPTMPLADKVNPMVTKTPPTPQAAPPTPPPAPINKPLSPPPKAVPIPPRADVIVGEPIKPVSTKKPGLLGWFMSLFKPKTKSEVHPNPKPKTIPKPLAQPDIFAHMSTPTITGKHMDISSQSVTTAASPNKKTSAQLPEEPAPANQKTNIEIQKAEAKSKELENKLVGLQNELQQQTASEARILELQKQLTEVLSERQNMQNELTAIKTQLERSQAIPSAPAKTAPYSTMEQSGPTVKVIAPESAIRAGLPRLTSFPNVVTGIIKDNEGNLLPGVLVTVRDKDDIPVRALKTNKLGQFAASTPLPSSIYFVEVEDPRNRFVFDRIQISLNGGVVPAIEVIAKSQKELSREKLRKEIFGNQQI